MKRSLETKLDGGWGRAPCLPARSWEGKNLRTFTARGCYPGNRTGLSGGSQQFVKFLSRTGRIDRRKHGLGVGISAGRAIASRRAGTEFRADKACSECSRRECPRHTKYY